MTPWSGSNSGRVRRPVAFADEVDEGQAAILVLLGHGRRSDALTSSCRALSPARIFLASSISRRLEQRVRGHLVQVLVGIRALVGGRMPRVQRDGFPLDVGHEIYFPRTRERHGTGFRANPAVRRPGALTMCVGCRWYRNACLVLDCVSVSAL